MKQRKHSINLSQMLKELQGSEGLPENLSTEAQLFDEILKKVAFVMPIAPW